MVTTQRDKMRGLIQDAIEEADIYFKCSGIQTEHVQELELEEWTLQDADAVINVILGIVSDYIAEVL
jgi:hypothetical protein